MRRGYPAVAGLVMLTSCVRVGVNSHIAAQDYAGSPKRIFVFNALDNSFSPNAPDSFAGEIQIDLRRCGVEAVIYRPDSMQLNAEATGQAAWLRLRPDAVLNIRQATRHENQYGEALSGVYVLTLRDTGQKRDIWKARMTLGSGSSLFVDRAQAGAVFARALVKQMVSDGVLKTCPADAGPV